MFTNGEKLIGTIESATSKCVTFKSEMAGKVEAPWSEIKELRSAGQFAVIPKRVKLEWGEVFPNVPQGTLTAAKGKVHVQPAAPAPPTTIPVENLQNVVKEAEFQRAMHEHPSFFDDWTGSATAGASLVLATQNEHTYTSDISLIRAVPTEDWLNPSERTKVAFTSAYGLLTQPGKPSVETSILHGEAQHDVYFTPSLFSFGDAAFDHNYAQGLDLQQTYGGGIGWTMIKSAAEEFDVKASLTYMRQQFQVTEANQNLVGSTFSEGFSRKFAHKILLKEQAAVLPAWNNSNALSAVGSISLTVPVYKRVGVTAGVLDNYLNNPPAGFKRNSFTFTTGATYIIP